MSLRKSILLCLEQRAKEISLKELYQKFPNEPKTTIRGRIYENLGKGITKVDKGLYISSNAIMEQGNSLKIIDRMVEEKDKFEFIFLDIPYSAGGQKGGNRNLFKKDTISPNEFGVFLNKVEQLLKDKDSVIAFMFTSGKSSKKAFTNYFKQFEQTNLIQCDKVGTYTKLWGNGNRMNMGKYLMPVENIYFFNGTGKIELSNLDFSLTPNTKEYPTSKPYPMIKSLVSQITKVNQWVFDPFGGSGKILRACQELNRNCHIIDSCDESINNHILKLI